MAKFDINTTGKEVVKAFAAEVEGKTCMHMVDRRLIDLVTADG